MARKNPRNSERTEGVLSGANRLDDMKREWELQDRKQRRDDAVLLSLIAACALVALVAIAYCVGVLP